MNKLLLSLAGVAAFAAFTPQAEARDRCYRPSTSYGHRYSHSYYQPAVRVYYTQPTYYRTYHRSYSHCAQPVRRVYYRSYDDGCRHRGLRGFIHGLFR